MRGHIVGGNKNLELMDIEIQYLKDFDSFYAPKDPAILESVTCASLRTNYIDSLKSLKLSDECDSIDLFSIAIKCFNQFLQSNWTGPIVDDPLITSDDSSVQMSDLSLEIDGENPYCNAAHRQLLVCAIRIFEFLASESDLASVGIWYSRAVFVWQRVLADSNDRGQGNSPSLMEVCLNDYCEALGRHGYLPLDIVDSTIANLPKTRIGREVRPIRLPDSSFIDSELRAELVLEFVVRLAYYGKTQLIPPILRSATETIGITIDVTGVEGMRRQFQTESFSQLACKVSKRKDDIITAIPSVPAPKALSLAEFDATTDILEDVKFTGTSEKENQELNSKLSAIEQCCIIAEGLRIFYSGSSRDELNLESVHAIAMRVISTCSDAPPSWIAFSMCLLFRSRAEFFRTNTRGRACFQTDALVEQFKDKEPSAGIRLRHIHTTGYPSVWELQRENGVRMMEVGMVMTACEMFKKLEMWPLAMDCLAVAGRKQEALDLLETLEPLNARLLVSKGDMTGEAQFYEQAWDMSNQRSARAMRSLGRMKLKEGLLAEAADCFEKSLEINPLFDDIWFKLGSIYLRLDNKEKATQSFVRCVNVNPEHVQAWVNLSAVYAEYGAEYIQEAKHAAGEAVRLAPQAWQFWENLTLISARAEDWQNVLRGEQKLSLHLAREGHPDLDMIRLLISKVDSSSPLRMRILSFLEDLVLKNKQTVETLRILADMYMEFNRHEEAFKTQTCRLKEILALVATVGDANSKFNPQEVMDETIICLQAIKDMLESPKLKSVEGITSGLGLTVRSVPRRISSMNGGQELPQLKSLCDQIQSLVLNRESIPE
jgi:tetratricopeptide (TPR) repeat protein